MRTALLLGLCVLGCTLEPGGDASSLSGAPGGGGDDDDGASSGADASSAGDGDTGGDDDTTGGADDASDDEDDGAVDSSGAGSSTGTAMDDGGGDPGPACAGVGDVSMPGIGGAVPGDQNCPHTDFLVQVVGSPSAIADVDVSIEAIAANTSQNRVWVVAPDGTQVLLFDHRGTFLTDDFVGTEFDDQAPTPIASAPGPFHGCFQPEQGLAALNGKAADGAWILRVETCLYETSVTGWQLHLDFE